MSKGYNDQESVKDLFNIKSYTEGLLKFLKSCQTPMTLAIQGNWGSGKTSMMKRLKGELEKDVLCYEINTWQYSQFDLGNQLPIAFFSCVLEAILGYSEETRSKVSDILRKSLLTLARFGTSQIPVIGQTTDKLFENIEAVISDDEQSPIEAINILKCKFKDAVEERLKKEGKYKRVIFFIDDLDRLVPQKAVELMEIMKIFLESENCVFVLAIDYEVVVQGVKEKYGDDINDDKARNFFDKIIQVPFSLPLGKYDIDNYIIELLKGDNGKLPYGINEENCSIITNLIRTSVGCNPRAIKRVINSYILLRDISSCEHYNEENSMSKVELILFASLCMQLSYEKLYEQLLSICDKRDDVKEFFDRSQEGNINEYFKNKNNKLFTDDEVSNFERFTGFYIDTINICSGEAKTESTISDEGVELLQRAIKSSSYTSVNVLKNNYLGQDDRVPAKFSQVYEVLKELKGKEINTDNISRVKKNVAEKRGISTSSVSDKTTRQLGINVDTFCEYVKDYFNNGDKLIQRITEKSKDDAGYIVEKFEELRK